MTTNVSLNPFANNDEQAQKNKKKPAVEQSQDINLFGNASISKTGSTAAANENLGLVSQEALDNDANMGLGIQRSTQTQAPSTTPAAQTITAKETGETNKTDDLLNRSADDPVWQQNAENNKKNGKAGFNKTLEKFYGKKFTEASPEEKEKLAVKYFDWIRSEKKGVISQSRQFELYKQRCESPEEYEFLCSVIDKMEAGEQAKAAKSVMYDGSKSQQLIGTRAVLRDYDNYSEEDMEEIKKLFYGEDFENLSPEEKLERVAIIDGEYEKWEAEHKDGDHSKLAFIDFKVNMNISRDNNIPEEERKEAGIKAVSCIQHANVEDQTELIDEAYESEIEDVRKETARQSHTYDKTVQKYAVDKGLSLDDEEIANILAQNAYRYDESVREEIINTLNNSKYDSVKETLKESKVQYEAEQKAKAETSEKVADKESNASKEAVSNASSSSLKEAERRIINILHNKSLNTTQKAKQLKTLVGKEQTVALSQVIKTSTGLELKSLALSGLKSEVLKYLFDNYSPKNASALESLSDLMTSAEKHHYEEIKLKYLGEAKPTNFFIH